MCPAGPAVPGRVEPFGADGPAGLAVRIMHAPGHTEGSTVYLVDGSTGPVALTGDVLFAGSIGRTDLPGGDDALMAASLARLAGLATGTRVLPGHGPGDDDRRRARPQPLLPDAAERIPMARPTPLSGFPEWLPDGRVVEQHVLDVLRRTFELHGFAGIETRAVEPLDQLLRKGETSKEVYVLRRLQESEERARPVGDTARRTAGLGLHFDLTVPFARYVLENAGHLSFPFRRYQIQKVWRGERPQDGRFREFVQADIDVVGAGELPYHYEVELPLVIADAFASAGRRRRPAGADPGEQPQGGRGLRRAVSVSTTSTPCCAASTSSTR